MDDNQQNSQTKACTQEDLAKRLDPFYLPNLFDGLEDSKYGCLADDVRRLCKLKRDYLRGSISLEDIEARAEKKPAKSANITIIEPTSKSASITIIEPTKSTNIIIIDSDDEMPQDSVIPLDDRRSKKLKEVIVVDDDEPWFSGYDKLTKGSASTSNALRNSSYGNSSGCLQEGCVGEGLTRNSTVNDNQTPMDVDAKEEEEH